MWVTDDGVRHVLDLPDPAEVLTPAALASFLHLCADLGPEALELDLDDRLLALADAGFPPDPEGLFVERAPAAGLLDGDLATLDGLDSALAAIDPRWQVDLLYALHSILATLVREVRP